MRTFGNDKVIYGFNPTNPDVYYVKDGESFCVDVQDCYSSQINTAKVLRPDIDKSVMNCSVGPIHVKGAKTGHVLCVEILNIQFAAQGVMVTSPKLGVLGDRIKHANTKILLIQDGWVHFAPDIKLPLSPMVGIIGVAPQEGEVHCSIPGDHGGNMDSKIITAGSKVYLPVFRNGAGLALGDLHAAMGDGALSGTGIETAGRVCLKTTVIRESFTKRPMVETAEGIYIIASDEDLHKAIRTACEDMTEFLGKKKNISFPDAYRLTSAACDIQISQVVNAKSTVRIRAPKKELRINSPV